MHKQTDHDSDDTPRSVRPHAPAPLRKGSVFKRGMYAVFPWFNPSDYPGCVHGLSAALAVKRDYVKANAYNKRGPSARACRLLAQFIKTRISELTLIAWELDAEADRIDAKTALRPGAQALARLRQQKAQNP